MTRRRVPGRWAWAKAGRVGSLRREISAGITAGLGAVPVCIASGMLAYAPLGVGSIAKGAAAGLIGGALAGIFAAIFATPSFVISAPRASISIIQATLAASLLKDPNFAGHPLMIVDAMSLCGLLAGIWQMLFSVLRLERIIKSTPHPVLAGFINGVAVLVIFQQLVQLLNGPMGWQPGDRAWVDAEGLTRALSAIAIAIAIIVVGARAKRVPVMLVVLIFGIVLFQIGKLVIPDIAFGPTIGSHAGPPATALPFSSLLTSSGRAAFLEASSALAVSSLVLALVAALESLLAYRVAQNLSHVRTEAARDVFGQGVGNLASALFGGVAAAASSAQLTANYEAGGRSRLSVVVAATLLFAVSGLMSPAWTFVPAMAVWAILIAIAVMLFDLWSLRACRDVLLNPARMLANGTWKNIAVAATVTVITASLDVITGVLAGILLAGILFIADMSRSIVRRRYQGDKIFSKRRRPSGDMELLRESGRRRAVLELEGVMFFGNADELSREVSELFRDVDMLTLDLRGVTDIDFSAATILQYESVRSRRADKRLLLCNVLPQLVELLTTADTAAAVPSSALMPDLDTALEWMEEETLRKLVRSDQDRQPLERNGLFRGLAEDELRVIFALLRHQIFEAGAIISREGDDVADEMWILTRGTVSIRLNFAEGKRSRRVASLGAGTVVGEMAFIESGRRSATIIADEYVECYVLDRPAYSLIGHEHPQIANKMLANLLHESMVRLRHTDEELSAISR
jgi:SulP family sulfate permease